MKEGERISDEGVKEIRAAFRMKGVSVGRQGMIHHLDHQKDHHSEDRERSRSRSRSRSLQRELEEGPVQLVADLPPIDEEEAGSSSGWRSGHMIGMLKAHPSKEALSLMKEMNAMQQLDFFRRCPEMFIQDSDLDSS